MDILSKPISKNWIIRRAGPADLDFLVKVELMNDGYTAAADEVDREQIQEKIRSFLDGTGDAAWIAETGETGEPVGAILARYRDRQSEAPSEANRFLFRFLDPALFPSNGRFCEVFNLWVHPAYRRQGLATCLKLEIEAEARRRGMEMVYTHTESANQHVIELNIKLGYQIVRTGPIGDEVARTSLTKWLK